MAAELDYQGCCRGLPYRQSSPGGRIRLPFIHRIEDGAYSCIHMACSEEDYEKLVPGTTIRVTGYKTEWSGEVEIIDGTFEFVEGGEYIAEPWTRQSFWARTS